MIIFVQRIRAEGIYYFSFYAFETHTKMRDNIAYFSGLHENFHKERRKC